MHLGMARVGNYQKRGRGVGVFDGFFEANLKERGPEIHAFPEKLKNDGKWEWGI